MRGIRIENRDPVQARETMRVVNETVSELYFEGELSPGMGALSAGATFNNTPPHAPVIEFPAGAGTWRVEVRRRRRWRRCGIHYIIRYTSDAGGGGNFAINFNIVNLGTGDTLGVPAASLAVALTPAAPAAANDIMEVEGVDVSPTVIPGDKPMVRFAIFRGGGNPNLLRILAVHYELLPQG